MNAQIILSPDIYRVFCSYAPKYQVQIIEESNVVILPADLVLILLVEYPTPAEVFMVQTAIEAYRRSN